MGTTSTRDGRHRTWKCASPLGTWTSLTCTFSFPSLPLWSPSLPLLFVATASDHCAGVRDFLDSFEESRRPPVLGNDLRIPHLTRTLGHGEVVDFAPVGVRARGIFTPYHTLGAMTFAFTLLSDGDAPDTATEFDGRKLGTGSAVPAGHELLFTGDSLFIGGCGRMFEGTGDQLHAAMRRLFPPNECPIAEERRWIFPGHEYTLSNYRFSRSLPVREKLEAEHGPYTPPPAGEAKEPWILAITSEAHHGITQAEEAAARRIAAGMTTVPISASEERETNVFVRASHGMDFPESEQDGQPDAFAAQIHRVTALRGAKDRS